MHEETSRRKKVTKGVGVVGSGLSIGLKVYEIKQKGYATTRDVVDITVNAAAISAVVFLETDPIGWAIGIGSLAYGIGTMVYDAYKDQ